MGLINLEKSHYYLEFYDFDEYTRTKIEIEIGYQKKKIGNENELKIVQYLIF